MNPVGLLREDHNMLGAPGHEWAQGLCGKLTNVQSVSRLVSSCGSSFKITISLIDSVFDLFSSKFISPAGKRICGHH